MNDRVRPERSSAAVTIPDKEPIPLGVIEKLIRLVHLTPEEIETMTREQAVERLHRYWAEQ
ncbi:hypothetical protein IU449_25870 [Nocardia higoensis]|uniref:Uncharacterized protein n=1 Tax=Nocardia higoensis TaxID=228599 RepID=A0ABS0DLL5_9NOCA|nr:hypothetical protein [Nocardia higoensis]MBF6357929.1 hypothetical protein [Nocardia higoensis]